MLDNFSMLYFKLNICKTNVFFLIFTFPILVKLKEKVMDNVPMPPKRPIPPRPPMKPQINRGVNENNPQATQAPTKPQVATQQTKVNTQGPTQKVEAKELSSAQTPSNANEAADQNNLANVQTASNVAEASGDNKVQVSPKPAIKAEKKDGKQEDEKEGKNHSVLYLVLSGLCFAGAIACFVLLFI